MGFGFGFPILIISTVGLLIYFFSTKKKSALVILCGLWALTIFVFILGSVANYYRSPIRLTKEVIIGEYNIDTTFFSGKNATWQHDQYKFFITDKDSIIFFVMKEKGIVNKIYRHKINYSAGPPDLWSINADSTHHIIQAQPTLYRGHDKFYYVFSSHKFGNMFFRKVEN